MVPQLLRTTGVHRQHQWRESAHWYHRLSQQNVRLKLQFPCSIAHVVTPVSLGQYILRHFEPLVQLSSQTNRCSLAGACLRRESVYDVHV